LYLFQIDASTDPSPFENFRSYETTLLKMRIEMLSFHGNSDLVQELLLDNNQILSTMKKLQLKLPATTSDEVDDAVRKMKDLRQKFDEILASGQGKISVLWESDGNQILLQQLVTLSALSITNLSALKLLDLIR
jgi:hypothetical protein